MVGINFYKGKTNAGKNIMQNFALFYKFIKG